MKKIFADTISLLLPAEKKRLALLVLADVIISLLDVAALAFLLLLINFYTGTSHSQPAFFTAYFKSGKVVLPFGIFLMAFSLKNYCGYIIHSRQYQFVYSVASRLSENNMRQYFTAPYLDHVTIDSAVHIRRVSQQPVEFAHYVLSGIQQVITQSVLISITITAVLLYNATLFLLLLLVLLPPVVLIAVMVKKKIRQARQHAKTSSEKTLQYLKEALNGYMESAMYKKELFFTGRYAARQQQLNGYLASLQSAQGLPGRLLEIFAVLGLFTLVLIHEYTANAGATTLLTIGAFMAAAYKIMPGMIKILNSAGQVRTYAFTVTDLLKTKAAFADIAPATIPGHIQNISFAHIGFSYGEKKILHNMNCTLQAGEMIGIAGISGSGKTTFINILCGFLDPSKGAILINGIATDNNTRQQYRQRIAYIKQSPFLIHGSIEQNISLQETGTAEADIQAAVTAAGLTHLLNTLPQRTATLVSENGRNISGGQRQRIAIARALYKDADLIILDEPFNELDHASELLLLQHFKSLAQQGKIVLLVTHNTQSLSFCDRIISLNEA